VKCRRCREPAVIEIPRHNAGFCRDCFFHHCQEQVRRAIHDHDMLATGDRVLVAVSGGKDSIAVWDILLDLGYDADGLYLGLGIGDYSAESHQYAQAFADRRGATLQVVDLPADIGFDIPSAALAIRRPPCAACGTSKRHLFNQAAIDGGYDVVVTGHNLDDEAAVLFGNVLHWSVDYLARQVPVLPATEGFVKKVKPLVRLGERETAAYCVLKGLDYIVEECPNAKGNTHLGYKEALNAIEARSPGTKAAFYGGFLDRGAPRFRDDIAAERDELQRCVSCGAPTPAEVCAFCRLRERATSRARPR
jgi:tRNA-5-methyluridine54 2-sulfurtransferase